MKTKFRKFKYRGHYAGVECAWDYFFRIEHIYNECETGAAEGWLWVKCQTGDPKLVEEKYFLEVAGKENSITKHYKTWMTFIAFLMLGMTTVLLALAVKHSRGDLCIAGLITFSLFLILKPINKT